jgi:hypothetical protein
VSCAAVRRPPGAEERAAAFARPEPDPSCRATVRAPHAPPGLEQVVAVKATLPPAVELVSLLAPELTPAEALELRDALPECAWRPALAPDGRPLAGGTLLVVERAR